MLLFGTLTCITLLIFMIVYIKNPSTILTGFLFNTALIFFTLFCLFGYFHHDIRLLFFLGVLPFSILIIATPFAIVALIVGLILNTRVLMKKEGRRLKNAIPLIVALLIIIDIIATFYNPVFYLPAPYRFISFAVSFTVLYFIIDVLNFFTAYVLSQLNRPKLNQDYIVVLGSGLIGDRVPPLLANRIKRAMSFYHKQKAVAHPPTIIFSGGQGSDELVPEAYAMRKYAIEAGIPPEHTIEENQSTTTYENMKFSKKIMDKQSASYNSIFSTNNFHLFRAGMYAKMAGLSSQGISAKTAWYFWPNAMIREYIAIVVMQKKRHMYVILPVFTINLIVVIILNIFNV